MDTIRGVLRAPFNGLRALLDVGFAHPLNPLRHLGSLTIFFLWIVLVSGLWLFIFFSTSVNGAYQSVEYLTHEQWWMGGVMRSLHRYASDAAVVTMVAHLLKEFAFDRYRGARNYSWITGIPLVWLLIPLGITGYWLVWDRLAQYVALASAELIDWLPIFTDSMARNFLSEAALSDRFFTLMAFLHIIGLPLFLVFGIWLHVFRINSPRVNPPRELMVGSVACLMVLSLLRPALSQGPADFSTAITDIGLDWYYLFPYPVLNVTSPGWLWLALLSSSLLLGLLPWLPRPRTRPPARVNLEYCNGCERCVEDCPFSAVSMAPRSDGSKYLAEAVVDPDLCVSCGICVGACPTATPFRTRSGLLPGIDLPDLTAERLKQDMLDASAGLSDGARVLVFGCKSNPRITRLRHAGHAIVELHCVAQLPPAFIDFALSRDLADGAFLAGCPSGDCQYRLGTQWMEQRIHRQRDPHLRQRVDSRRVALGWHDSSSALENAVAAFQGDLANADGRPGASSRPRALRWLSQALAYAVLAVAVGWLATHPRISTLASGQALVSLSFSHAGERVAECKRLTQDELNKLPPNMRKIEDCPRQRHPLVVRFEIDGEVLYDAVLPPSGLWGDGEANVYQRFPVAIGERRLRIALGNAGQEEGFKYQLERTVQLRNAQHLLVEFDHQADAFVVTQP